MGFASLGRQQLLACGMMLVPWSRDDIPSGASAFAFSLALMLGAVMSLTWGRLSPGPYHPLVARTGVVTHVTNDGRSAAVSVEFDTLPGAPPLMLTDPELRGAQKLLRRLRRGERYDVTYDPWTQRIWEVEPSPSTSATVSDQANRAWLATDVHFGPSDIAAWRVEDHAVGRTRAEWLGILGIVVLLYAVVRMVRFSADDTGDTKTHRG